MTKAYEDIKKKYILFFRVQDHLRKMGLGRKSLVELKRDDSISSTNFEIFSLNAIDKMEEKKFKDLDAYRGKDNPIKILFDNPIYPNENQRKKFKLLFDSVEKGIEIRNH
jgi:hypothetical protein